MEFSLLWAALTAGAAVWVGTKIWGKELPRDHGERLLSAALLGLVTGRLVAMVAQGVNPITNPMDFIIVRGGVSTQAATVGAVGWLIWSSRRDLSDVDVMAPVALLGLAGWHAGCLWRSACLGTATDLPWAWSSTNSEIMRHPVELYAAVLLVIAAFLVARLRHRLFLRFGMALAAAGLVRLITEPLRPSLGGGPLGWYALGVLLGVGIVVLGGRLGRSPPT